MSRVQRTAQLAAYVVLLVTAAACGSQTADSGDEPTAADLDGGWMLTAWSDHAAALAGDDSHPITLDVDGNEVSGISACNNYSGTIDTAADQVTFGNLGGTEMACVPSSVLDLEQAYLTALQAVTTAQRDGDSLTLTGPDLTLSFEPIPAVQQAALVGTSWRLESLIDGDTASSVSGNPATLLLHEDSTLTGSTGCRHLTGAWTIEGGQVLFTRFAVDGSCPAALRSQDGQVVSALGDGFTPEISGDMLTVTGRFGDVVVYRKH